MTTLQVGQAAPDFELPASNGSMVRLSDFRGRNVLLYFYAQDNTETCTIQACDFRNRYDEFVSVDTVIIGISPDSVRKHNNFINKYNLPFVLLSDEDRTVAKLYGVWALKKFMGREYMGIVRSTFAIDREGKLASEWRSVRLKGHADETLQFVSKLP